MILTPNIGFKSVRGKTKQAPPAPSFDPDYQAVLDYMTAESIPLPDSTEQNTCNKIIVDLKSSGVWDKIDSFFRFKGASDSSAKLVDWKRLIQADAFGSLTWDNSRVKGNGTNAYIDSLFITSNGVNSSLNSVSIFVGISDLPTNTQYSIYGAQATTGSSIRTQWSYFNSESYVNINSATGANDNSVEPKIGINSAHRSDANTITIYGDTTETEVRPSEIEIDRSIFLLARNLGLPSFYSDAGLSYWMFGENMEAERITIEGILI